MQTIASTQVHYSTAEEVLRERMEKNPAHWLRSARIWRHGKHGYVWRIPRIVRNGIRAARVQTSSLVSNTCCTTLLMQGAPPSSASSPP